MSVIWSSPLSDHNRVVASNQFALPIMGYLMWTQNWPIAELRQIDREVRKILVESGGKHPLGSTVLLYLPREKRWRGLKSVEQEYKLVKIKAALKVYKNLDPTIAFVRKFEERAGEVGHHSFLKDSMKYAAELGLGLDLEHPSPGITQGGVTITDKKTKVA